MYATIAVLDESTGCGHVAPRIEVPQPGLRIREFSAHEPLFLEGDEASHICEVLEGAVCCFRVLSDGRRQVISFAYPGDFIGLENGNTYRFSCEATCAARVAFVPRDQIFREANENPELGRRILECAGDHMSRMLDHFVLLGRKSALEKVASFLLSIVRRRDSVEALSAIVSLPMTRADIADYLGITNETVSRCLSKLKARGVIDLPQPQTVVIHDMAELEGLGEQQDGPCKDRRGFLL